MSSLCKSSLYTDWGTAIPDFRKCPVFPKWRSDMINAFSSSQKMHLSEDNHNCCSRMRYEIGKYMRAKGNSMRESANKQKREFLFVHNFEQSANLHIPHLLSCICIFLILSSSFSEDRFSLMLSTFNGKQNGVNFSGNVMTILLF